MLHTIENLEKFRKETYKQLVHVAKNAFEYAEAYRYKTGEMLAELKKSLNVSPKDDDWDTWKK